MNMNLQTKTKETEGHAKGFTLLELLIVISIIAILSVALVFVLNPAETLKKARDAQRISDLKTMKTAIGLMLTSTSTPSLDGLFVATTATTICTTGTNGGVVGAAAPKVRYSSTGVTSLTTGTPGADAVYTTAFTSSVVNAGNGDVAGGGWIPAVLSNISGGSPISNYPLDPTNTASGASMTSAGLAYRYACQNAGGSGKPGYVFEIDAVLESDAYTSDDNKRTKDGGDNSFFYETGTSLKLLPTGDTF